jgi:hypothetical protein
VIGYTLSLLNNASTIYHKVDYPGVAPMPSMVTGSEKLPESFNDNTDYKVIHLTEPLEAAPAGKYLVFGGVDSGSFAGSRLAGL